MLYIFFCGFKVLLPMNITCYYYLKVGLKEAAWSSSILRGREFCYVGAHSPKNLKIYLPCFSEVIGPCSLVDQPVSKFLQSHYRLSQPWQELILISIRYLLRVCLITALVINVTWSLSSLLLRTDPTWSTKISPHHFFLWKNPYEGTLCGIMYFVSCSTLTFSLSSEGLSWDIFNTLSRTLSSCLPRSWQSSKDMDCECRPMWM